MRALVLVMALLLAGCSDPKPKEAACEAPCGDVDPAGLDRPEPGNTTRGPMTWTVVMEGFAFVNGTFAILPGDSVQWVHQDGLNLHRVETANGTPEAFDSGDMTSATNAEFNFTFDVAGTYEYFCRHHAGSMRETLYVNANATIPAEGPEPEPEPTNATGPPRGPVTWGVDIRGSAFVDGTITIQVGDTVEWTHDDGAVPHTVTSDTGAFDSGPTYMVEGPVVGSFDFEFVTVGEYPYHCEVHPSMQATITVLDRFDGTP